MQGRGALDVKGGGVVALHALAALRDEHHPAPTVVPQAVASEEDGGLGAFAALERDAAFDACLIPEPTGFDVVCAQAGALTFRATVRGRAAHAAMRLEVEGRLGVPLGEQLDDARAAFKAVLDDGEQPPVEVEWAGGQFAPGETAPGHPWVRAVAASARAERGTPPWLAGVPYGADMRLFCARGIPCVMVGTGSLELAPAVDERVRVDDLAALARILVRVLRRHQSEA